MKQVIHVHIPRTAGRSMMVWAVKHSPSYQCLYRSRGTLWNPSVQWTYFGHYTLDDLMGSRGVLEEWWHSCFKFAFVRNTFSRLVSVFDFVSTRKFRRSGKHWTCKHLKDFPTFIEYLYKNKDVEGAGESTKEWPHYNHRQLGRLKRPVDFLGRFENLSEDWKKVCELSGIKHIPLGKRNVCKRSCHYTDYYTHRLRKMVEECYEDEIQLFQFKFGE